MECLPGLSFSIATNPQYDNNGFNILMPRALLFKIFLQFVRALCPQVTTVPCGGGVWGWCGSAPSHPVGLCSPVLPASSCGHVGSPPCWLPPPSALSSPPIISSLCLRFPSWPHLTPLLLMAPPSLLSLRLLPLSSPCLSFSPLSQGPRLSCLFPVFHLSALPTRPQISAPSSPLTPSRLSVALSHRRCPTQAARTLFSSKLPTAELLSVPGRLPGQGLCMFPWLTAVRGEAILLLCSQELV